jgi:diphthamide synthase subunit DPH2
MVNIITFDGIMILTKITNHMKKSFSILLISCSLICVGVCFANDNVKAEVPTVMVGHSDFTFVDSEAHTIFVAHVPILDVEHVKIKDSNSEAEMIFTKISVVNIVHYRQRMWHQRSWDKSFKGYLRINKSPGKNLSSLTSVRHTLLC